MNKKQLTITVITLMLTEAAAAFETSMIYAAVAKLINVFGDPISVGWLITIYLLIGAGTIAVAARLGDIYGRRICILILLVAGIIGSLISACFDSFALVLLGRGLQGLTAAILPLTIGLVRELIPQKQVSITIGLLISAAGIGSIAGLVVGGIIIDNLPWQSIFFTSAALAATAFLAIWLFIRPSTDPVNYQKIDYLGGALFMLGITGLLLSISKASSWNVYSFLLITITSLLVLVFWFYYSFKHPDPLINVRVLLNPIVLTANAAMALTALGSLQLTQVFSLLLQQPVWTGIGLGASATAAGLIKLPSNMVALGGGPLSGILLPKIGPRRTIALAATLTTLGWGLAYFFHSSVIEVAVCLVVISFGTTMIYAALPNIVATSVELKRTSEAAGVLMVVRSTFMAIGAQLIAVCLSMDTLTDPSDVGINFPSQTSFSLAIGVIILLTMGVALTSRYLARGE